MRLFFLFLVIPCLLPVWNNHGRLQAERLAEILGCSTWMPGGQPPRWNDVHRSTHPNESQRDMALVHASPRLSDGTRSTQLNTVITFACWLFEQTEIPIAVRSLCKTHLFAWVRSERKHGHSGVTLLEFRSGLWYLSRGVTELGCFLVLVPVHVWFFKWCYFQDCPRSHGLKHGFVCLSWMLRNQQKNAITIQTGQSGLHERVPEEKLLAVNKSIMQRIRSLTRCVVPWRAKPKTAVISLSKDEWRWLMGEPTTCHEMWKGTEESVKKKTDEYVYIYIRLRRIDSTRLCLVGMTEGQGSRWTRTRCQMAKICEDVQELHWDAGATGTWTS